MNQIYDKNISALQRRNAYLYKRLIEERNNDYIEVLASRMGALTMKVHNIFFHSAYNPLKDADYLTEDLGRLDDLDGVMIFGLGLGYHVKKVWSDPFFKGKILVVEKDLSIFKKTLETVDLVNVINDANVFFIVNDDPYASLRQIEKSGFFSLNMVKIEMILHPPSMQTYLSYYVEVLKGVRGLLGYYRGSFGALAVFKNMWQENSMDNIVTVAAQPGIKDLRGIFKDIPAIIVSAGPSLVDDLDVLREAKGRIPIFCVGTAYKALIRGGIRPDFVVVVDAKEKVIEQIEGVDTKDVYLFAADFVNHQVVEMFYPRVFFFSSPDNPFSMLLPASQRRKGKVYPGGSVAHAAIDIAVKMGFNPIIMIGQDLSYRDNRTHAEGTIYENKRVRYSNDKEFKEKGFVWLKGNYEDKVLSTQVFHIFLSSLVRYIRAHPDVEFINCTSGGAFVEGAKIMSLKDALSKYGNRVSAEEVRSEVQRKLDEFVPDVDGFFESLNNVKEKLTNLVSDLEEGFNKAEKLKRVLDSDYEEYQDQIRFLAAELEELGRRIDANPAEAILKFGGYYNLLAFDIAVRLAKNKVEAQKMFCASASDIYKMFLESSHFVIERINKILEDKNVRKFIEKESRMPLS